MTLERSLGDPRVDELDPDTADPMGPMPHDPSWANGDDQPILGRVADAVRSVIHSSE